MSCGCGKAHRTNQELEQRVDEEIGKTLGLQEVFSQSRESSSTHGSALSYLRKAQRAERLGYGADIAELYRNAAGRDAAQGIRQVDAAIARLDARTNQPDWAEVLKGTQEAFSERGGPALVEEMKERLRLDLLENDVTPDISSTAREIGDRTFDSLVDEGLSGSIRLLRDALSQKRDLLSSLVDAPTKNSLAIAPITPIKQETINCITIVVAIGAINLAGCCFTPYCWCCVFWLIAGAVSAGVTACYLAFEVF